MFLCGLSVDAHVKIAKILVPVDGSANSMRGLEAASSLASKIGSSVILLHSVYEPSRRETGGSSKISSERGAEISKMMANAESVLRKAGVQYTKTVISGDVGHSVVRVAHSKKVDMIVIGSRGRGAMREVFFGSTTNYVVHASKVPVLIVK